MARPGGLNSRETLNRLLREVGRRLWLQRLGRSLAWSSWLVVALSMGALAWDALFEPPRLTLVWSAAGTLLLAAIAVAAAQRPGAASAAAWADRWLGGASAYAASLEFLGDAGDRQDPAALAHLDAWTATAAETSRQQLREMKMRWLPARSAVAAVVSLVLASLTITLSEDVGARAIDAYQSSVPADPAIAAPRTAGVDGLARELAREAQVAAAAPPGDRPAQDPSHSGPAGQEVGAVDREEDSTAGPRRSAPRETSPGGGRQAGRTAAADAPGALTSGDLRLRLSRRDLDFGAAGQGRASTDTAGHYLEPDAGDRRQRDREGFAAAAARLPAATLVSVEGPAEHELVRRYFEERGRQP